MTTFGQFHLPPEPCTFRPEIMQTWLSERGVAMQEADNTGTCVYGYTCRWCGCLHYIIPALKYDGTADNLIQARDQIVTLLQDAGMKLSEGARYQTDRPVRIPPVLP